MGVAVADVGGVSGVSGVSSTSFPLRQNGAGSLLSISKPTLFRAGVSFHLQPWRRNSNSVTPNRNFHFAHLNNAPLLVGRAPWVR